eukprot:TRINITY_DN27733_c0_g1_i1.p1 TRINITY_DN27733_c0_g1~~TRINITY_DN27733_c0_g1_i1.p1  ORF type:complete len:175 (-),score=35.63 TRINITY_DN27733_c0_g1_i1:434-958(-)
MGSGACKLVNCRNGTQNSALAVDIEAIQLEDVSLQEAVQGEEEYNDEQDDGGDRKVSKSSAIAFGKTQTGSTTASTGYRYPSPLPSEVFDQLEDYKSWNDDSDLDDEDDLQDFIPRVSCRQYQLQKVMEMEEYLKMVSNIDKEIVMRKLSRSEMLNALRPNSLPTQSMPSLSQE